MRFKKISTQSKNEESPAILHAGLEGGVTSLQTDEISVG